MLRGIMIHGTIMGETVTGRVARRCPRGGVMSSLLWNLAMDGLLRIFKNNGNMPKKSNHVVIMWKK